MHPDQLARISQLNKILKKIKKKPPPPPKPTSNKQTIWKVYMLQLLLKRLSKWFKRSEDTPENEAPPLTDTEQLENFGTRILMTVHEDGDFEISTNINNLNEPVADATGTVLYLINSGLMADIFVKSLHLWAEDKEQKVFIHKVLENWKNLYDEDSSVPSKSKLAVDPSDVFGLKSIKGMQLYESLFRHCR